MTSTSWSRKTTRSRWDRLEELFNRAVDLPDEERGPFVLRETGDDDELREELLGLLACDTGKKTGPLTHALGEALDSTTRDKRRAHLGRMVGNYKLVSVLGHGGTGTVYLGERADSQYTARVAVKIVDSAAVQGDIATRFRAERQILASLNHPNISRLLDAGETEDGRPYLVMEYVEGETLDRYCDERRLDLNARLRLFLEICGAVQYAHQNLIVHRDLKPANILVTTDGMAKLLDFGIAKLLDPVSHSSALALTRMNDRLLTPEYASPEQILGKAVTTASDVYALGVVLYELLTGMRPFVVPASASQLELERTICIADPPRPSATMNRPGAAQSAEDQHDLLKASAARSMTPERLRRRLSGDLDAITMRALRKEPQHRYGSVEQFVADIQRYLSSKPVHARQGNWLYYSQRFVRRNAVGVAAGAGFLAFAIAFVVAMSIQTRLTAEERDRATQESRNSERVLSFMLGVFAAADPFENLGKDVPASELLDRGAERIKGELREQPEVRARLLEAIGRIYGRQGQTDKAIVHLRESLRTRDANGGKPDIRTGSVLTALAQQLRTAEDFQESDKIFQQAFAVLRATDGEMSAAHGMLLGDFGRLEFLRGNIEDAEKYLTASLALMKRFEGAKHPEVASILNDLSGVYLWKDDLVRAEQTSREAVSIYSDSAELHPDRVFADYRLAEVLFSKGLLDESASLYEKALKAQKKIYGEQSNAAAETLGALAQIKLAQNRPAEAEQLARKALDSSRASRPDSSLFSGNLQTTLARALLKQRRYQDAERELRSALELFSTNLPNHQYVAAAEYFLGETLLSLGNLPEAEQVLSNSRSHWQNTRSPAWRSARSTSALAEAQFRQGRFEEAERNFIESYRVLSADKGADREALEKARERVTHFYRQRGEPEKLKALLGTGQQTAALTH